MSRYSQMSKIGPRRVALQRHWGPLLTLGAPICRELPTASTAHSSQNFRHMSVSTRGASPRSAKKPAAEVVEEKDRYKTAREYLRIHAFKSSSSSSSSSSENVSGSASANQAQRENYEEKQSDTHVDFQKVKEPPSASNQQWWYPDPFTGHYVPRDNYGEISTSSVTLKEAKHITKEQVLDVAIEKALKKPPAPSQAFTKISGVPSKGEKGGWWTSMEELPDLDHCSMRC